MCIRDRVIGGGDEIDSQDCLTDCILQLGALSGLFPREAGEDLELRKRICDVVRSALCRDGKLRPLRRDGHGNVVRGRGIILYINR